MGILVLLLLYVLPLKSRNFCRLSLQMFSKDANKFLELEAWVWSLTKPAFCNVAIAKK